MTSVNGVKQVDETDRRILGELQADGRASFREISSRVKVSTPTVSSRVQIMTDNGLIRGYSVMLDADMLGQVSVATLIDAKPSEIEAVVDRIRGEDIVLQVHVLSDSRILCILSFYDQKKYQNFVQSLSRISEIAKIDNSMILKTEKELPRASLTAESGLHLKCYYCGHQMKDEGVRLKLDGKTHYVCCGVCAKLYKEKYERMKDAAGRPSALA
jgi:Lrp/AsnC family leucine-responsive transcriptional regulator